MTNLARYNNLSKSYSQIYQRYTLDRIIVTKLAPMFSAEGWEEILKMAAEETNTYCGLKKPVSADEAYRIQLLPAKVRAEQLARVGVGE